MFKSIFKSVFFGAKIAFVVAIVAALIAFLSAPVFFGITLLTATAVGAVVVYCVMSFLITSVTHFFGMKWYNSKGKDDANTAKAN